MPSRQLTDESSNDFWLAFRLGFTIQYIRHLQIGVKNNLDQEGLFYLDISALWSLEALQNSDFYFLVVVVLVTSSYFCTMPDYNACLKNFLFRLSCVILVPILVALLVDDEKVSICYVSEWENAI